jgi:hypothetical protein
MSVIVVTWRGKMLLEVEAGQNMTLGDLMDLCSQKSGFPFAILLFRLGSLC